MSPQWLLRQIRAVNKGKDAAYLIKLMQTRAKDPMTVSLDPYAAQISYDPTGYKGKAPYTAWESRALPMDDADLPTKFDTHKITGIDTIGRTLGDALEHIRSFTSRYPEELVDVQLTPGGAHAFELGSSRGREGDFTPFGPLSDPSYTKITKLRGGNYAARLGAKPERGETDFGAIPFMRIGGGPPIPYKADLLALHDSILRELYPASPLRRDAIRTLAAQHERSLYPKDAALMRAIYGLGVAGAAANLKEDPDA